MRESKVVKVETGLFMYKWVIFELVMSGGARVRHHHAYWLPLVNAVFLRFLLVGSFQVLRAVKDVSLTLNFSHGRMAWC